MNVRGFSVTMVALAAYLAGQPLAQVPRPVSHPSFVGVWVPSVPEASDQRYGVGLTRIPGHGQLKIDQRADRLTVTITIPDAELVPMLAAAGRFFPTAIYHLSEADPRPGSPQKTQAKWVDDRLVVPNPWPGMAYPTTQTYSLDGDRLKVETLADLNGRESKVTEWFTKAK